MESQPPPSIRVWLKPRGTTGLSSYLSSVLVPKDCLVDDLKWYLKEEMKPTLDKFPKPAIQIYSYNMTAEDFHLQQPTKMVAQNPNPEVLKETPGLDPEHPMFWDWDQSYESIVPPGN
eukprot:TRINITY_DN27557_c0_g1_i1.p1 TRINITY_DN27557_c0_g1~~TRINITY_DN27557_c0_g1_i1.p1  ORF type:complete len:118 (+),score=11.38 TRINITY_DN27557_c0_g1_i1:48-401(+)